jgi:tRNA(fMet)-specific endonuclease VapC
VVAHLRGRIDLQSLAAADEPLFLPLVALGELYRGVLKSARPEFNREKADEFLEIAAVLSPDVATAEIYARIAQTLEIKGTPIPENDIWMRPWHWNATCRLLPVTTTFGRSIGWTFSGGEPSP